LGLSKGKKAKKPVKDALYQLMDQGKIIKTGRAYGLTERMSLVKGVLEVHRSGVGFVIPETNGARISSYAAATRATPGTATRSWWR
jgi:exoribonuclease R